MRRASALSLALDAAASTIALGVDAAVYASFLGLAACVHVHDLVAWLRDEAKLRRGA